MIYLSILAGLVVLVVGAELLVRGATHLAGLLGISPLVVGLTIVAFGTSSPELAVSVQAAAAGRAELALGNVIGSNIFNVLFILGLAALIAPLVVARQLVRFDVPVMIGVSVVLAGMARDGSVGRIEGILLVTALFGYVGLLIQGSRRLEGRVRQVPRVPGVPREEEVTRGTIRPAESAELGGTATPREAPQSRETSAPGETAAQRQSEATGEAEATGPAGAGARGEGAMHGPRGRARPWLVNGVLVLVGLGLLVLGSEWFVGGAAAVAAALGASELLIGLTLVAAGTSLPEVATSLLASVRGRADIAVGNVVGSNVFNVLGVLGLTSAVAPVPLMITASARAADLPILVAVAIACLPIFFTGYRISRWEGGVFLAYYAAYIVFLILRAGSGPGLDPYAVAMLIFVLPITAGTLAIVAVREYRSRAASPA